LICHKNWEAESETHLTSPGLGLLARAYGLDLGVLTPRAQLERRAFLLHRLLETKRGLSCRVPALPIAGDNDLGALLTSTIT
jgi:hypothetical protein